VTGYSWPGVHCGPHDAIATRPCAHVKSEVASTATRTKTLDRAWNGRDSRFNVVYGSTTLSRGENYFVESAFSSLACEVATVRNSNRYTEEAPCALHWRARPSSVGGQAVCVGASCEDLSQLKYRSRAHGLTWAPGNRMKSHGARHKRSGVVGKRRERRS